MTPLKVYCNTVRIYYYYYTGSNTNVYICVWVCRKMFVRIREDKFCVVEDPSMYVYEKEHTKRGNDNEKHRCCYYYSIPNRCGKNAKENKNIDITTNVIISLPRSFVVILTKI